MGKKIGQLLLVAGIDLALLLILVYGTLGRGFAETVETGLTGTVSETRMEEKVVALTFDDDVIIGLSQEISYKEAVSMI